MAEINITRRHTLGRDDARKIVETLVGKLIRKFGGASHWQGNRVHYSHTGGVEGDIHCHEGEIAVAVTLGFMMSALRGVIEAEIRDSLDKYLV